MTSSKSNLSSELAKALGRALRADVDSLKARNAARLYKHHPHGAPVRADHLQWRDDVRLASTAFDGHPDSAAPRPWGRVQQFTVWPGAITVNVTAVHPLIDH